MKKKYIIVVVGIPLIAFIIWGFSDYSIVNRWNGVDKACQQRAQDLSIRMDSWQARKNSIAGSLDLDGQIEAERQTLLDEMNILRQECPQLAGS